MKIDFGKWLSQLPIRDEIAADYIELDGFILKSSLNTIRFIVGKVCFEIATEDLLKIEETTQGEIISQDLVIPVRARFRKGASILDAYPSDIYMKLMPKSKRPFALCIREDPFRGKSDGRFRALEIEFLRKHNLLEE